MTVNEYQELALRTSNKEETVFQMNIDKLKKRYPEGFDVDKSINKRPLTAVRKDHNTMTNNYDYIKDATVILNSDIETPVSIEGPVVRADWYDADEGLCGDYNPEDPDDIHLLRFDIYIKKDGDWEPVDDASYCTRVPFETDTDTLVKLLYSIYKEYNNVLSSDPDISVKKLGEALSWIEP